jgi:hypothetical protein
MIGYKYNTEQEAIDVRSQLATYKGLPKENGTTLYWVDYNYSEIDGFYYIVYDEGVEVVLGEPIEFEVTEPQLDN